MVDAEADTDADAEADADGDESETDGTENELLARVAAYDEELAAEVGTLEERIAELEAEIESREEAVADLEERLKRERADFRNYKKRAKEREEEIRERATEDLVSRLLDVRDNLGRALSQDDDAGLREGLESTLESFDRILADENVERIEPAPGDDVDPTVHEVLMRTDGDQPADAIEEVYRPGYAMGEKVLRPAQVTVSEGGASGDGVEDDAPGADVDG